MKKHSIAFMIALIPMALFGQLDMRQFLPPPGNVYYKYVTLKHNGKLLSEEYDPRSDCKVSTDIQGKITVETVFDNDHENKKSTPVEFMVAIHNRRTNTRWMYTNKPVKEVSLEYLISKCEPGDKIMFMTVNQKYMLAYNEIELETKC